MGGSFSAIMKLELSHTTCILVLRLMKLKRSTDFFLSFQATLSRFWQGILSLHPNLFDSLLTVLVTRIDFGVTRIVSLESAGQPTLHKLMMLNCLWLSRSVLSLSQYFDFLCCGFKPRHPRLFVSS